MDKLFDSLYVDQAVTVEPQLFLISLLVSLGLGIALAQVYKHKTLYTREFVTLLSLLPALISLLIFLVNGNLGTSVAVAGTFSLVRFRSAAGGARELLMLFIAMGLGLATGSGYLLFALLAALFFLGLIMLFDVTGFAKTNQLRRQITLIIPAEFDHELLLEVILQRTCQFVELIAIKNKAKKNTLMLEYVVDLKPGVTDKHLVQELLAYKDNIEIAISRVAGKKKTL